MYLRRRSHTIMLEHVEHSQSFNNDATFLMDHPEKNISFTSLKLFSHRSWKLFSAPDFQGPLIFDDHVAGQKKGFNLLVIAQPCLGEERSPDNKDGTATRSPKHENDDSDSTPARMSSARPRLTPDDPVLNEDSDTQYVSALTNKGTTKNISNEYAFEDFKVPDFIMDSLVEENKNAGDGVEIPKQESKLPASLLEDSSEDKIEHQTRLPTAKETITNLPNLMNDNELNDLQSTLKDFQYGSKGCKLFVAEDTANEDSVDEDAEVKDTVARPEKKKCKDEFPDSCQEMARKGHCLAFKSLMSSVCRKSCNLCDSLVDTGFTKCTRSCGGGRQMRMIKIHRREYLQTRRCNTYPCPIDGGYSDYGHFTECSATCGEGVKFRRRTCTNPRAQYNGRPCKRLGPSIKSEKCDAGPCPNMVKDKHHDKHHKDENKPSSGRQNVDLHIDGKHSDQEHMHLVLLKGKKVAKLRCKPRKGELRSLIEDAETKRFIIHQSNKSAKKSDIEEGTIIYNKEGLPIDTSSTIVKALQSPYKIILSRKGPNKVKLIEECLEAGDDSSGSHSSEMETDVSDHDTDSVAMLGENKQVHTNPDEKSMNDFDEYKYEKGNVVTPQVTSSSEDDNNDVDSQNNDYSTPKGKLFDESKDFDSLFNKMNAVKPKLDDQLAEEQNIESTYKMANGASVEGMAFNEEQSKRDGDSASQAGFTVSTAPDSHPSITSGGNSGNGDNNGYEVESVPGS